MLISSHVALSCKALLITERFYSRYFGFQRARVISLGNEQILFIKSGNTYLELFQSKGESPLTPFQSDGPTYPGLRHIAFQVEDVDRKLADMGTDARITLGPLDFDDFISGWRSVWLADPDGNIVEISQGYVDQENPPQQVG
ncbi:MAG: glyoxalase [Chloroflexi bacterium RBG_19FT_COMBO_49_13]|nr:MAG: glyoxalase [Chloroflexi bacterium RBG_16_47_49]OGO61786.1 MAG: glyoxalase [Chloroflexi bacterium RBG_19FT_COMBO_49_13]